MSSHFILYAVVCIFTRYKVENNSKCNSACFDQTVLKYYDEGPQKESLQAGMEHKPWFCKPAQIHVFVSSLYLKQKNI